MTYPNGTVTDYVYDRRNRLKTLTHKASTAATAALLLGLSYTVDASGLRTHLSATRPNPTNPAQLLTLSTTWIYDAVNRLTQEVVSTTGVSEQRTWSYDAVGNRLRKGRNGVSTDYSYDHNDRLLTEKQGAVQRDYTYDASGNLLNTKQGSTVTAEYRWDVENRMVGSTIAGKVLSYGYDPNGIRRSQETIENNIRKRTEYLVDPNQAYAQVIEEWQAQGSTTGALPSAVLQTSYIYGDDLISQTKAAITQFYHYDGLGSVRLLSDQAAAITDRYTYAAFGEADAAFGAQWSHGSTENNYRYAGEQLDPNLGFYYLRARYMDPAAGRFLGMDSYMGSSMDPMSLHKYSYAHNYPTVATDPSGNVTLVQVASALNITASLALTAISSYEFGGAAYQMYTGEREISAVEIGRALIWAYVGSKAGILGSGFEKLLRKSGCLSNSFSPDTLVETSTGLRRIDEILEGDKVWSLTENGEIELQEVTAVMFSTDLKDLVRIAINTGESITATPEHLMFTDSGLVEAGNLIVGSKLITATGFAVVISLHKFQEHQSVYDLTVAKNRNFFITTARVLVHNISPCEKAAQAISKALPNACKIVGQCKEYAEAFETLALKRGLKGKRLCLKSRSHRIWSERRREIITTNGDHAAALVGEMVFDNLNPDGIPLSEWKRDLGVGEFADISMTEEDFGSVGCLNH
jgi:RHS repeat-associated protein